MADHASEQPIPDVAPAPADESPLARAVFWQVAIRLIPFLFLLYWVNILDRVNINFARLTMLDDLGLSETVYGFGSGLFYVGYCLFEIPSNLVLHRVGARRWISRIMVSWGIISVAMMLVRDQWSFYALRFALGVAEAGFFPGIILYLSYWFPVRQRAKAVAFFMMGSPLAGAAGNAMSGAIMDYLNEVAGLPGWQWLFLVEGLPAVLLGFATWFYLTDRPEGAYWLSADMRGWLAARMQREETARQQHHGLTQLQAMMNPRVLLLTLLYFTVAMGANGFGFYLAVMLKEHFVGWSASQLGLLAVVPNAIAVIPMYLNAWHSDHTGERRWHIAGASLVSAAGWALSATAQSPAIFLLGMVLAQSGIVSMLPTFWALPTALLSGTAAAGGIALINSFGNLGGAIVPVVTSRLKEQMGSFAPGQWVLAATMLAGAGIALAVRHNPRLEKH